MFIEQLAVDPQFYFSVVVTVIVSIVLHELAHGWVALWLGDETPRLLGHLTANPLVHMPPISIGAVLLVGLGWGSMPVRPDRLRGEFGHAIVAFAGPAMNLVLAAIGLVAAGLIWRSGSEATLAVNGRDFLWVFGSYNVLLAVFNLIPVPPLDGSRILADFFDGYAKLLNNPSTAGFQIVAFALVFMFSGPFIEKLRYIVLPVVSAVAGTPLELGER